MKITAVDTAILRIPTRKPIALDFPYHSLLVAHVRTDEGVTGLGYTLAFGGGGVESIQAYLVTRLAPLLIGQDPLFVERLWERMYRADRGIKRQGIAAYALSALDIGLWDLVGKTAGLPLYKLWGAVTDRVEAYGSGGWGKSPIPDLIRQAQPHPSPAVCLAHALRATPRLARSAAPHQTLASPHVVHELSLQVAGALPNGFLVEFMDWAPPDLFAELPRCEDGAFRIPDRPGHGM